MISWPNNDIWQLLENLSMAAPAYNPSDLTIGVKAINSNNVADPNGNVDLWKEWVLVPDVPNILPLTLLWQSTTFNSLINLSEQITTYAATSISAFQQLNNQISAIHGQQITPALQLVTESVISNLNTRTQVLITEVNSCLSDLKNFLLANQAFDGFLTTNYPLFSVLNVAQFDPGTLNTFEASVEKVIGTWNAISNDLQAAVGQPLNVTLPFLESLNINNAITDWMNIQSETQSFSSFAGNQTQYWNYQA